MHAVPFTPVIAEVIDGGSPRVVILWVFEKLPKIAAIRVVTNPVRHTPSAFVRVAFAKTPDPEVNVHARIWS